MAMTTRTRRELLQLLAAAGALATGGCQDDAAEPAAAALPTCKAVGAGAVITHGPISGAPTASSVGLAVRLGGPAKVAFDVTPKSGGKTLRTGCALATEADDFSVVLSATGLAPGAEYDVVPVIDDVPVPTRALVTRTFAKPGTVQKFSFVFGSCCRYDDQGEPTKTNGKVFEVAAQFPERPWFFAQIGDWTYPDYLFANKGLDDKGMNYTVYAAELAKAWRRKLTDKYAIRKLLSIVPVVHVWDDHDFAENNASKDVSGDQQLRVAAFQRYLPCYPLAKSRAGVWQRFSVGHCDFFLVDMRSQRTDIKQALKSTTDGAGKTTWALVEPPGHTMLGAEQLAWLLDGLVKSTATWKFVFMPVEINPRYDKLLNKAMADLPVALILEALGDMWSGYPTERNKLLALHQTGKVKNIVFLTGDAHMGAMKPRDADCPPIHMAANLDIEQAPIMDFVEKFNISGADIWPEWFQKAADPNTIGRVVVDVAPAHKVTLESWSPDGQLLHSMTVDAQA